ncbi:hypothetical protein HMPREF1121_01737 [Porphyromonas sp. KLE 1280]|nr:hypothetical protein HMPREF1121_01737 [Porphyromonas sp. KLE 1280]
MAHTASILYRRREERRAECGYTPSQGSSKIDTKIQLSIDADSMRAIRSPRTFHLSIEVT